MRWEYTLVSVQKSFEKTFRLPFWGTGKEDQEEVEMTDKDDAIEPQVLQEPGVSATDAEAAENPWMRGLWMLIMAMLFGVAETVLLVAAVVQFCWLLFAREKNVHVVEFGEDLSDWLARTAKYLTGTSEDRPFPFTKWGKEG
ncbi:MAG: hypothetical protein CR993_01305 [Rhodobacterales bacterium]|nr:MAG: hypothetical protein CR993_01305 [Rhodobacterales bacterium]